MWGVWLLAACQQPRQEMLTTANAVYYWRTDLQLDSTERSFIDRYQIKAVYCRYFDVVMTNDGPMPNATITFSDTLPEGVAMVPTVYITEDCMQWLRAKDAETRQAATDSLARRLVKRILQMNETNDITGVGELQIDCDYTASSRQTYYEFLRRVADHWQLHNSQTAQPTTQHPASDIQQPRLSATIRLHQLAMSPPPVDYGVLMLYNTGDPRKFTERNPVLDRRDVQPYLRYLGNYSLPLAAAYPVYLWQRTISGVHVEHAVEADEILRVKQAVEHERPELGRLILTYHLDKENIQRYKPKNYEEIYRH